MKNCCKIMVGILGSWNIVFGQQNSNSLSSANLEFIENKGQIADQFAQVRNDIYFSAQTSELNYFFKDGGLSYQICKVERWKTCSNIKTQRTFQSPASTSIYRVDINWLNANKSCIPNGITALPGLYNYYNESCKEGALNVQSFNSIQYKQLYPGINVNYYSVNGAIKYDIIVAANADYQKIQFTVDGATGLRISAKEELIIETPMGTITENRPVIFQNKKRVYGKWRLQGNTVGYEISGIDHTQEFVIDPLIRAWGTYIGNGNGNTYCESNSVEVDAANNTYVAGSSANAASLIATSGAHQFSFGGDSEDAYLIKYNSSGQRIWGTFYGGNGIDRGYDCCIDNAGNIFLTGTSSSQGGAIATAGSHQPSNAAGLYSNAFLVKFNSAGQRLWGTFYGGSVSEAAYTCSSDANGNVFIGGQAFSSNGIATAGCYQSSLLSYGDGFFAKFSPTGTRLWGSYIGGWGTMGYDIVLASCADAAGNIIIGGSISSTSSIGTAGVFQSNPIGGEQDGFVAKFDLNGSMMWGTYYGVNTMAGSDDVNELITDNVGDVYIVGNVVSVYAFTFSPLPTASPSSLIATPGSYQPLESGSGYDMYLAKLSSSGARIWGTYFGSSLRGNGLAKDANGDLYVCGSIGTSAPASPLTNTTVMTPGCHQATLNAGGDAFFAKLNPTGSSLLYATYYGGAREDFAADCVVDALGNLYFAGNTLSYVGNYISTPGTQQPTYGGNASFGTYAGFLTKFSDCAALSSGITSLNPICYGTNSGSLQVSVGPGSGPLQYLWQPGGATTSSLVSVGAGTYMCVMQSTCGIIAWQTATLSYPPAISVLATSSSTQVCAGNSADISLQMSGGTGSLTIVWPAGSTVTTPTSALVPVSQTGTVQVQVSDDNNCVSTASIQLQVNACVSLEDNKHNKRIVKLAPNPANEIVHLYNADACKVQFFNSVGALVKEVQTNDAIDVSDLSKGIYLVQFTNDSTLYSVKLIKE